ncbi:MAG: YjgN family protein [Bdellovibrionaceae bacterium]|nr:YjgN family protein [Pseudobdellovibrionaceae bacterium]
MTTEISSPLYGTRPPQTHTVEFRGSGSEYFRIWIINTLLTIVTLGIYSPWAKVRKMKYFYRNTYLAGDSFDYHADPIKILIGRVIILVLFLGLNISQAISPMLWGIFLILLLIAFPWVIVRSAIFKYRNSSYRNIRFGFNKNYADSYFSYILSVIVTAFTLYLAFPYALYRHYRFILNNIRYGKAELHYNARAGAFFKLFYTSILLGFVIVFIPVVLISTLLTMAMGSTSSATLFIIPIAASIIYLGMALVYGFQRAMIVNEITNNSSIANVKLKAHLGTFEFGFIVLTNLLLIVFTLGFGTPWAQVRALKYRLENTSVEATEEDFNQFLASQENPEGYAAEAATDFWDIDFGL